MILCLVHVPQALQNVKLSFSLAAHAITVKAYSLIRSFVCNVMFLQRNKDKSQAKKIIFDLQISLRDKITDLKVHLTVFSPHIAQSVAVNENLCNSHFAAYLALFVSHRPLNLI